MSTIDILDTLVITIYEDQMKVFSVSGFIPGQNMKTELLGKESWTFDFYFGLMRIPIMQKYFYLFATIWGFLVSNLS